MFMSITDFQKRDTVSIWMFNNILLNKSHGMLPQYKKLPYYKYNKLDILKNVNHGKLWI